MPNRPSIPREIERQILIESGHRCVVCGAECPLERAHIIPWHRSKEHLADDLICLCANCHERADQEKWGEATLREYKLKPWVLRHYKNIDVSTEPRTRVEVRIHMDFHEFNEQKKSVVQFGLAKFLDVPTDAVQIVSARAGSVLLDLEIPAHCAAKLIDAYKTGELELAELLGSRVVDVRPSPLLQSAGVGKPKFPSDRVRIGIAVVGCGYWGPNLVRHFLRSRDCDLKLICDVREQRLSHMAELHPKLATTTQFKDVVEDPEIDAVAIATPLGLHFEMAKACLNSGKHTLIEKPMASSSAECEELIEIARRNGLILMVGHTYLYSSSVKKIADLVKAGDLGEIRYINCRRLNLGLFQKNINVAWDLAPHDISIILHVLGECPVSVNCSGNAHVTSGIEDVTNMSLSFQKKRFATIQSSWLEPRKVREMTIVGTRRMIVYDDLQTIEKIRVYDVRVERPPHYDTFAEFQYSYHYGDSYIPHILQEEPLKGECQHFLDCIKKGSEPHTSGHHGLEVIRILEAASTSLKRHGGPVGLGAGHLPSEVHDSGTRETLATPSHFAA